MALETSVVPCCGVALSVLDRSAVVAAPTGWVRGQKKACAECGGTFASQSAVAKYCGDICRHEARKRLAREKGRVDLRWREDRDLQRHRLAMFHLRRAKATGNQLSAQKCVVEMVATGGLRKPETCCHCSRKVGRSLLQGHHADYHRPLFVKWLCQECHSMEHACLRMLKDN